MHSTYNEGKPVVVERFIRTLKNKICKLKKLIKKIKKNVYIDKLDDIVNKYNNTYHSAIKINPTDVQSSRSIDSSNENSDKDPKLKLLLLLQYQNIKKFSQKIMFMLVERCLCDYKS